ncbi:hypothetical protein METY_1360 [Methylopila sp. Yamaguchi]|nr:hypothetical protein METY_1360 [Methylopila sp. Yamaguchi]
MNESLSATTVQRLIAAANELYSMKILAGEIADIDTDESSFGLVAGIETAYRIRSVPIIGMIDPISPHPSAYELEDKIFEVTVPVFTEYAGQDVVGFQVLSDELGSGFPNLTIVICLRTWGMNLKPAIGQKFVTFVQDTQDHHFSTILEFREDPLGKAWLVPLEDAAPADANQSIYLPNRPDRQGLLGYLVIGRYVHEGLPGGYAQNSA